MNYKNNETVQNNSRLGLLDRLTTKQQKNTKPTYNSTASPVLKLLCIN